MGKLIPTSCVEVLPNDVMRGQPSALIRVSPLVAPVMHPCTVRFHTFFVPMRILKGLVGFDWESFITGGPDGADVQQFPFFSGATIEEKSPAGS